MKKVLFLLMVFFTTWGLGAASSVHTVLVLPFENQSTRSDLNWISEGFAEILSSRLSGPNCYTLGRDERDQAYALLGIPQGTPLTLASEYKVAETLGVDWEVVGSFSVEGDRLSARARLLDIHALKLGAPLEISGALADLADLPTRLAWRLLATHDPQFTTGAEEDFRRRFPDVRLDAFENYIRGVLASDDQNRVRFWTEAARLNPQDHRAAFRLGRFYFEHKDYANSAQWLGKLEESDTNYLESLFLLAVDEYFLGRLSSAEKILETLAPRIPLNEISNNLGVMKAQGGDFSGALPGFERAYQGDSSDPDFCLNLGACLWRLGRYDEAIQSLEPCARRNNEDPEAHALLADLYRKLGDSKKEDGELQWLSDHEAVPEGVGNQGADFSPEFRLKKNYDGRAFRLLSLTVRQAQEESLSRQPVAAHSEAHRKRGRRLLEDGRLLEAQEEATEAVSLVPGDSEAHLLLARVYEAQGRHREATMELETSLRLKNNLAAHLLLARIYLSLDRAAAARSHGRAALELDPGNHEAEHLIHLAKTLEDSPVSKKAP